MKRGKDMDISIDKKLSEIWNESHDNKISPENMWEICRELCDLGLIQQNSSAVSAVKVGPFKIATSFNPSNDEALMFFIECIFPIIVTGVSNNISFEEAYQLYIIPIIRLFIYTLKNSFFIKDENIWKIMLYIKKKNLEGTFPTIDDLNEKLKQEKINANPEEIIRKCNELKNNLGESKPIFIIDSDNRIQSLI